SGTTKYEIVGDAVRIRSKVDATKFAIGTRVGLHQLLRVWHYEEQVCAKMITTYNCKIADGYVTQGGYANYNRSHAKFEAAPMLCGGITTYAPLVPHSLGPGKVGVLGIGGLGHFGVNKTPQAVPPDALSNRKDLCEEVLGAHHVLDMPNPELCKAAANSLNILLCTAKAPDAN
ncbi:hypothetical protein ACHHYP_11524, partial [Achlya hypogyna]